jgi:DNA (cytosine-5)-methyltransferase 1
VVYVAINSSRPVFSGSGGFSTGAKLAGINVIWCANHWTKAVLVHAMNHPKTEHVCQDLHLADWTTVPDHHILLASPSCAGHTKARGKNRKHHDKERATAWAVISAVEVCQPPFLIVENVVEFKKWQHYHRWFDCLSDDYHLSENVLDAADFGVPQHRVRLFITGVHKKISKFPISITSPRLPHEPASSIIDWDEPSWSKIYKKGRSPKTLLRIENGKREFGKKPFLVAYYGATKNGRSLNRPVGTLTTKDRYALIDGNYMRMLNVNECKRGMGFPENYILPENHTDSMRMIGNAVCPPVARYLLYHVKKYASTLKKVA